MKKLTFALLFLCGAAHAQIPPYGIYVTQADVSTTFFWGRYFVPTNPTDSYFFMYNGGNSQPKMGVIGSGLSWDGTTLSASSTSQVNSDWTAVSGVAQILNKPSTFTPSAHTHDASDIVSGTLATARLPALAISQTTNLQSTLDGKFPIPAGSTTQYVRGDGTLATFPTLSINDSPGRTLVTATNATGFQVSSSKNARGCYEGSFSTTSTIGGPSSATVFLETADTNSTTPGDWTIKARQTYSNNITLAVVLNQVQGNNWSMCRDIPAGKYVRLRSGSISGTASASINTEQQETTF